MIRVDNTSREELPIFYTNLQSRNETNVQASVVIEGSYEEDSDFVDTNYEIDDGDADLFVDNVDVDILDEGASLARFWPNL